MLIRNISFCKMYLTVSALVFLDGLSRFGILFVNKPEKCLGIQGSSTSIPWSQVRLISVTHDRSNRTAPVNVPDGNEESELSADSDSDVNMPPRGEKYKNGRKGQIDDTNLQLTNTTLGPKSDNLKSL